MAVRNRLLVREGKVTNNFWAGKARAAPAAAAGAVIANVVLEVALPPLCPVRYEASSKRGSQRSRLSCFAASSESEWGRLKCRRRYRTSQFQTPSCHPDRWSRDDLLRRRGRSRLLAAASCIRQLLQLELSPEALANVCPCAAICMKIGSWTGRIGWPP